METLLDDKGLLTIVKREEVLPQNEEDIEAYNKREKNAYALIGLDLEDGQAQEIRHTKTAKEAWDTLMKLNKSNTMANVLRLKREFLTTKMKPGDKVREHAQKLRNIASQLQVIGHTLPEDEVTYILLNSFPSSYAHLAVSMHGSDVVQDLDKLMAILEQEEQRQSLQREEASISEHALLSQSGKRHDYVKNWHDKFQRASQNGWDENGSAFRPMDPSQVICHYCPEKGHVTRG